MLCIIWRVLSHTIRREYLIISKLSVGIWMLMDKINVVEWFRAKSPSLTRCKEGDLPLLNFSNLTCMVSTTSITLKSCISTSPECSARTGTLFLTSVWKALFTWVSFSLWTLTGRGRWSFLFALQCFRRIFASTNEWSLATSEQYLATTSIKLSRHVLFMTSCSIWFLVIWFSNLVLRLSPKSVQNRCVIEVFGVVFVLSRCFWGFSVGVGAFIIGLSQISSFFLSMTISRVPGCFEEILLLKNCTTNH